MGPKYRSSFEKLECPIIKREKIIRTRHRGSITTEVYSAINKVIRNKQVEFEILENIKAQRVNSFLDDFDILVFATGFESSVPNKKLLNQISKDLSLKLTPCGVLVLKDSVKWANGLYTSGALAEMRIGPILINITGARSAAIEIINDCSQ